MAQCLLLCLILASFCFLSDAASLPNASAPTPSPSNYQNPHSAETPTIRKLGKDSSGSAPAFSPAEAPGRHSGEESSSTSGHPSASVESNTENGSVQGQEVHLEKYHRSVDRSIAGGGVILGGLATSFLVAVCCYIRATGRHKAEARSQSNGSEISA